jgi:hypothetical protein
MKAEHLLLLATARGINLELGRPKRDVPLGHRGVPRRRVVGQDEHGEDITIPGVLSAYGNQVRSSRQPEWSARELGMAAQGMPDIQWRSICWVIGGEEPSRMYLKGELLQLALQSKEREAWPDTIRRGNCGNCGCNRSVKYVEDLCVLALTELANPNLYAAESDRANFFSIAEHNWRRHVSKIYQSIYVPLHGWYVDGIRYMQRRLNERDEREILAETA